MLPRFLIRLLCADPDQLLKDIAHLNVVHPLRGKIDSRESLNYFIEQILFSHAGNLLIERKAIHDVADVFGKLVDIAIKIGGKLVGVVKKCGEIEFG